MLELHPYTFGKGVTPASGLNNLYFRSNGNLGLWAWSQNTGDFVHDFINFGVVLSCYGKPVGTPGCTHWQEGIGNPGADGVTCCQVTVLQVSIVLRFIGLNWVAPFSWTNAPPVGIAAFPPVLFEGGRTLNPARVAGCAFPANGLPTVLGYPNGGGYDC